ncbi:tetratricopeptide repeat protein [Nitzschia inconspicua]|uniref:Tetratricopeptide repeat protein n=1 Tax=Nitzschia inconspicua TaxID=303405 RepID=A0A9K3PYX1_9STRA|nr:tetratricopeptide repeat protein [Nitzschia inconspicua]
MPSDFDLQTVAEEFKKKGNEAFQRSQLDDAIQAYSHGLVQVDRIVVQPPFLKATLLSNRAACYLKQGKLEECQDDCSKCLDLLDANQNDEKLRSKVLYRRAKALFLKANMPHKKQEDDLHMAAKDLLTLLSFDSGNKEATQLLNTIRAQHSADAKNNMSNTPVAKTLREVEKKDEKLQHNLKVLLGLLTNDNISASMEVGRLGGVKLLMEIANDDFADIDDKGHALKNRRLALQCLSCAGSHPPFCRRFMNDAELQTELSNLIVEACEKADTCGDIAIGALTVYLRLILHLDRDGPDQEITGKTDLVYQPLIEALKAGFRSADPAIIRASVDILSSWTAGKDREQVIRSSLADGIVDLPIPLTKYEMHQLKPKEFSDYKQRLHSKSTRDQAWAFERSKLFFQEGGLESILNFSADCEDPNLRREITALLGKLLTSLDSDVQMQEIAKPIMGYVEIKEDERKENEGPVIEEIDDEDDEEGKVVDVTEEDDKKAVGAELVTLHTMKKRAELASAMLMANGEIGGWALGSGWPNSKANMISLAESGELNALRIVAELLSSAASVKSVRPMVAVYLNNEALKSLVSHEDRSVRTAAASAVAKLGLGEHGTQDYEIMSLVEAACYMLEEGEVIYDSSTDKKSGTATSSVPMSAGAKTAVDRGVEVLTYLITKTIVKEEIAHGFKATSQSKYSGLELLVKVADNYNAGENVTAFGLASIFQLMAATPLTLRKESFEGKEITMEQYDEIQKMQKTSEQKETEDDSELKDDNDEQCSARVVKMVKANVPRALIQLTDGASDQSLEQIVLALNRLANVQAVRGSMIQQGVLSGLIKLEKEEQNPSDVRKKIIKNIRHCMAKLLVTTNPGLLTSAQSMGAIKPLIQLVRQIDSNDLQRFEALLSLTNLGSMGDNTKSKIVGEKGLSTLKYAMFSDNPLVKKAATECMCNLVGNDKFMKMLQDVEELRLWLALASDYEENFECARAAAGCIAMATGDPDVAKALIQIPNFKERMDTCLESGSMEIIHRTLVTVLNLVELGEELKESAVSNGLVAFSLAYVESYHDGSKVEELDLDDEQLQAFQATIQVAKQIIKAAEK